MKPAQTSKDSVAFAPHRGSLMEVNFRILTSTWDRDIEKSSYCGIATGGHCQARMLYSFYENILEKFILDLNSE